ncbi:hypothetical protein [Kitasatospora sp. NPDC091207]|uniref:hypothetical protein n=1 Tax=Kitasatospora sp. NPDC091207 TaxID=3364083 RepID=UPI0038064FA0
MSLGSSADYLVATAFVTLLALALLTVVFGVITALTVNRRNRQGDDHPDGIPH